MSNIPIKIISGDYEVIASGIVHLSESEIKFEIANLKIKYKFKTDDNNSRFDAEVIDSELVITLYNFKNSLGEGKLEPVEIGTINGRNLFTTFFVNTIDLNTRQFNYSFLLKKD